ncbi:leucine-rich_repeat domain-containing protein [Hexamita inflata]|uniref:Leucine-rich repeat domain-containing protein n=1 Tax=Hexamita inflata TaxID=28002 RepID=A0AA86UW75_9EUKA|nr:leucine-rich repeat domain-containing protein [Hexamita inflata]
MQDSQTILDYTDEFRNQIKDNILKIYSNSNLYNIEFLNDCEIEALHLFDCNKVIPKLNNPRIKFLELNNCKIKRLDELQLPNLEVLELKDNSKEGNNILKSLGKFKKLKGLLLRGYIHLDLKLIPKFQFTKIGFAACGLANIESLTQFTNLANLSLSNISDLDIIKFSQMVQLTKLELSCCSLQNVNPLKSLVNLNVLNLSQNKNLNIHPLQFLKQLTMLNLEQCALIDLTYLKPLIHLEQLNVSRNNIVYLEPLKVLKQMKILWAHTNQILNISVLNTYVDSNKMISYISGPDIYEISYQKQPCDQELVLANKLRDINAQIDSLRTMKILRSNLKFNKALQRKKIQQYIPQILVNLTQFTGQVVLLFQQLSSFQHFQ